MKTPFEQKLAHFQKSFVGDENLILKSDGSKTTPDEYVKSLGAEKFNPSKLKREMEHHKSMASMTGDKGHMKVYEHLSKMHKDHPVHKEGDAMEKKTLSANKAKETKAKNAKAKAKDAKAAEKAKAEGKNVDPKKKDKSKETAVKDKNAKSTGKDKPLKEEEKYSSPDKKEVNGKVDPKKDKDSKHVEVKVVINKAEREAELLSVLGIDIEKADASKNKYGKGKKTVGVTVKGKKGYYVRQQVVGTKNQPAQHKINKNAQVGGGTKFGAALNNLVTMKMADSGMGKGAILTEIAIHAGYDVNSKGVKASDPKSSVYAIMQGKTQNVPEGRKKLIAEYFGKTVQDMHDIELKSEAGEKAKIANVDMDQVKAQSSGFSYESLKQLMGGNADREYKLEAMLKLGLRNGGIIARLLDDKTPYAVFDLMKARGIEHNPNDGFDMAEMREGFTPGIKRRTVSGKFAGYRAAVNRLVNGDISFAFAYGKGGVGKTYHADQVFEARKQIAYDEDANMSPNSKDYDYVVISGRGGMGEGIKAFHKHRDKLIVFDDYDSLIKPSSSGKSDMANILKAAFDSGKKDRRITHGMDLTGDNDDVVPKSFVFKGQALMITNLKKEEVPQPILDRTGGQTFDLSMDLGERLELIDKIYETDKILDSEGSKMNIPHEIRQQARDFISEHAYDKVVNDVNQGDSITPRLFKGLAITMKDFSQMNETQLLAKLGKNWKTELQEIYFDSLIQ